MISSASWVVELDIENVDVGKALEQHRFAFHDRFAGHGSDVAEAEDSGAVGDHGHQIALAGVAVGGFYIFLDLETRNGDARSVG